MDYITAQTPDKGVQIGPEPPISNDSMAMTPDKGVQIGKELPIIDASTALTPDKGVQIGPELPINNYSIALAPDKGVQVGPEPPISNDSIAMINDTIPGFGGNLIEAGIVLNGTKSAVYKSTAYPANADGTQRPGAVVEYSSEFSVGEGFSVGGAKSDLPRGYIAAEFLDFNNSGDIFATDFVPVGWTHFEQVSMGDNRNPAWNSSGWITTAAKEFRFYFTNNGWSLINAETLRYTKDMAWNSNRDPLKRIYVVTPTAVTVGEDTISLKLVGGYTYDPVNTPIFFGKDIYNACYGRLYCVTFYNSEQKIVDFAPCISSDGRVAIVNRVTDKLYPTETFAGIVGFTLAQARKLSGLPATGGTLTVSLPTGYETDAGVANALETARGKGWTLTIQTYTPENATAAASTFALRRIWVRKTQDDNGAYIDTDGNRWQVDWCVDMLTPDGSTPDAYGYEMFRNIDAAVAYWELTPYVDPDVEEEFSQEL